MARRKTTDVNEQTGDVKGTPSTPVYGEKKSVKEKSPKEEINILKGKDALITKDTKVATNLSAEYLVGKDAALTE